jgi:hypothetical protein
MCGKCLWPLLLVPVCALAACAQTLTEVRFTSVFENQDVAAFSLELPARSRATVYQGTHDVIWLALKDGTVNFVRRGKSGGEALATGDVRFFPAFQLTVVSNEGAIPSRGVLIELKTRGLASGGCGCGGDAERAICGCASAGHLPDLWALALGQVTLGGTTLRAAEGFQGSNYRDNMLMIAVTGLELQDDAAAAQSPDRAFRLGAGQARWIPAGAHQFRNTGSATVRFLTIEF